MYPGLIFQAKGGPGLYNDIRVANDISYGGGEYSDQLGYFGMSPYDSTPGSLGVYDLSALEVGFYEYTSSGIIPTMLINDSLPTGVFSFEHGYVFLNLNGYGEDTGEVSGRDWQAVSFVWCNQIDTDDDGLPDSCDYDQDGVTDADDSCPEDYNPGQVDTDEDGIGDACDNDNDNDGVLDDADNCRLIVNPGQDDFDGDGLGDTCDLDSDNDGYYKWNDCNDFDTTIYPGASDIKHDGIDQDCDGSD